MTSSPTRDHQAEQAAVIPTYISYYHGCRVTVSRQGDTLIMKPAPDSQPQNWHYNPNTGTLTAGEKADYDGMLPVLESLFGPNPALSRITLRAEPELRSSLARTGIAQVEASGQTTVHRESFWQLDALWLTTPYHSPYAQRLVMSDAQRRHPVRPAKKSGTLYRRFIPWLAKTLSFRTLDIGTDLSRFHRWMHDPRVAQFWEQADSQGVLTQALKQYGRQGPAQHRCQRQSGECTSQGRHSAPAHPGREPAGCKPPPRHRQNSPPAGNCCRGLYHSLHSPSGRRRLHSHFSCCRCIRPGGVALRQHFQPLNQRGKETTLEVVPA